jgi:hypothetical protein
MKLRIVLLLALGFVLGQAAVATATWQDHWDHHWEWWDAGGEPDFYRDNSTTRAPLNHANAAAVVSAAQGRWDSAVEADGTPGPYNINYIGSLSMGSVTCTDPLNVPTGRVYVRGACDYTAPTVAATTCWGIFSNYHTRCIIGVDPNANGTGWSVEVNVWAQGDLDLLSIITHELGHSLGANHNNTSGYVMIATLPQGIRRSVPNDHEVTDWNASFVVHAH